MIQLRNDPNNLRHLYRGTGLSILTDDVQIHASAWSAAPRHVSIALPSVRMDGTTLVCFMNNPKWSSYG